MTLDYLENVPREFLTPAEVGKCLGIDPQDIRYNIHVASIHHLPNPYEFPYILNGNRIKFPKRPFIKYMRGEK